MKTASKICTQKSRDTTFLSIFLIHRLFNTFTTFYNISMAMVGKLNSVMTAASAE